ncbi:MAG: Uma2 family endonuclease [Segetibacter sp.]|nr:Uma2 family endonuclease [Segetibacter sp.]
METYVKPPRTGMEAFELMPEGTLCQLINDVLVMSPAPTTPHARVQRKIFSVLNNYIEERQLGEVFFAPVDVYLNRKNAYQPAIFFVSGDRKNIIERKGISGAPDLVVEILSEDRNYDLNKKKVVYEQTGVTEYWVVDPDTKWCEGFILENGAYKSLGEGNGHLTLKMFDLPISF